MIKLTDQNIFWILKKKVEQQLQILIPTFLENTNLLFSLGILDVWEMCYGILKIKITIMPVVPV